MRARPGSPQRAVAVVSLLGFAMVGLLAAPIARGQDESFETALGPPTFSEDSLGLGWTDSYDYSLTQVEPDVFRLSNGYGNVQLYEPVEAPSIIVVSPVANPPVLADPPDTMPKRILVMDDEATVQGAFTAALSAKGHHVSLAKDGRQAFRILRQEHFDLVFLDILLPVVGGASVLKAITQRAPEALVVLITGFPHHDDTLTVLEHGLAMLLPKPITLTDIDAVLKIVFKGARTS